MCELRHFCTLLFQTALVQVLNGTSSQKRHYCFLCHIMMEIFVKKWFKSGIQTQLAVQRAAFSPTHHRDFYSWDLRLDCEIYWAQQENETKHQESRRTGKRERWFKCQRHTVTETVQSTFQTCFVLWKESQQKYDSSGWPNGSWCKLIKNNK